LARKTLWIDTSAALLIAAGGQTHKSLMTGVSSTQTRFDQMTLLRTVIGLDVARFIHDSGEGSDQVSLGIGVTSQEAFAAGSLSDPEVDTDFPSRGWIWRARYRVYGFAADQPAVFNTRVDLDIRSMRKLENGEVFFVGSSELVEGNASTTQVIGLIRQLWQVG